MMTQRSACVSHLNYEKSATDYETEVQTTWPMAGRWDLIWIAINRKHLLPSRDRKYRNICLALKVHVIRSRDIENWRDREENIGRRIDQADEDFSTQNVKEQASSTSYSARVGGLISKGAKETDPSGLKRKTRRTSFESNFESGFDNDG